MYQEFFTRTLESKFIKNILYNTPLPTYKVVRDGDYVFGGNTYIYKDDIIRVNYVVNDTTGTVTFDGSGFLGFIPPSATDNVPEADKVLATYTIVDTYTFGKLYPQFTERFISEYGYYDSGTHETLGKYLRCIRNLYDIDLMPFYNCFSGRYATNLSIAKTHDLQYITIYYWNKYNMPITAGDITTATFGDSGKTIEIIYGSDVTCVKQDNKYITAISTIIEEPSELYSHYIQFNVDDVLSQVYYCGELTTLTLNEDTSYTLSNAYPAECSESLPETPEVITFTNRTNYPNDEWLDGYWYEYAGTYTWDAYEMYVAKAGKIKDKSTMVVSGTSFTFLWSTEVGLDSEGKAVLINPSTVAPESLDGYFVQTKTLAPTEDYGDIFQCSANTTYTATKFQGKFVIVLKKVYVTKTYKSKTSVEKTATTKKYPDSGYYEGYWYEYKSYTDNIYKTSELIPMYTFNNVTDNEYKLLQIPISLNQDYTIALDSDCEIYITPAILKNSRRVSILTETKAKIDLTERLQSEIQLRGETKYKHPFLYRLNLTKSNEYYPYITANERYLYLLIQIPATETTSITVLEGDYTNPDDCTQYFNWDGFESLPQEQKDRKVLSKLSLLMLNDKKSYAFSHRLIEYLTKNVITPLDEIDDNITRVQKAQGVYGFSDITTGIWDEKIRLYYYYFMMKNHQIEHFDLNGYIDKNTEKWYV